MQVIVLVMGVVVMAVVMAVAGYGDERGRLWVCVVLQLQAQAKAQIQEQIQGQVQEQVQDQTQAYLPSPVRMAWACALLPGTCGCRRRRGASRTPLPAADEAEGRTRTSVGG